MMNLNQKTLLKRTAVGVALATALGSLPAVAATHSAAISIKTIQDVTITERQPLLFAVNMPITPLAKCGFTALAATDDWGGVGEQNFALTPAVASGKAMATGNQCIDTTSTTNNYGHYLIEGAQGTAVKVTLKTATITDKFKYEPQGLVDINSATATSGASTIAKDTQVSVTLPATGASAGQAGLLVGGEVTVDVKGLAAGETIDGTFDIEVVY